MSFAGQTVRPVDNRQKWVKPADFRSSGPQIENGKKKRRSPLRLRLTGMKFNKREIFISRKRSNANGVYARGSILLYGKDSPAIGPLGFHFNPMPAFARGRKPELGSAGRFQAIRLPDDTRIRGVQSRGA